MANLTDAVFNSLHDDDFLDLFRHSFIDLEPNVRTSATYENTVVDNINSSSEELVFDFDYDPVQPPSSQYLTENQLKNTIKDFTLDTFSLFHLNIRSINKHFEELQLLLDNPSNQSFSIIGLTETWLSHESNQPFALNGYDFVVNNRQNRIGGGVALYVSHNYDYVIRDEINSMNDIVESLFIEISIPGNKNIIIGIIYRPPSSNLNDFIIYLADLLRNPLFSNKDSFIMGDFNIDLLKHDNTHTSQEFLETFLSASFLPLISKPTRASNHSATLIDNIFCNTLPLPDSFIVLSDMTDHFPIMTRHTLKHQINNGYPRPSRRRATHENIASLGASLDNVDWSCVYDSSDVNVSFDNFLDILTRHLDNHIPKQQDKRANYKKSPRLPWVTKSLLRSINRKNNLYYKFKMKRTEVSKNKYTSYKNTLTRILRLEKRKYYANQFDLYKHDLQNTWKVIKHAMNISKNKSNITRIKSGDEIVEDSKKITNIFNTYFSSIGENLAQNIPPTNKHFSDFLGARNPNSIFFTPTNRHEIINIVFGLNDKKSAGHDEINNFILKGIILSIVDPLVHIFNESLLNGQFPERMKIAKVIPLFKKGDKQDISNYRPISLLSSLSKILEKIIYSRTVNFFKLHGIFSNFQFGFREKHSTIHALLTFLDKVAHAIDKYSHLVGIFLDFSKAFDTINHEILLYKLSQYGIRGKALEWFRNYLTNRKQYVSLNNCNSNLHGVNCGVPQGSLLGPLLFIVYINDFCRSSDILSFILFADDSNLFFSHDNPHTLVNTINSELKKITQWIRANKLSLNLQKTKYMLFSNTLETLPTDIIFDDTRLENVSNIKFLGVFVDNKLSWKPHIDNICKTISRNIGIINRLKFHIPLSSLFTIYSSLILPYLNYGILAWGNTHQILLDKLLLLQKKSLRIICNSDRRSHTDPLFFENKILKIGDLYLFQLGQFMYNYNSNILPHVFDTMFPKNQSFHSYPTRQSNEFHLPLLRTVFAKNTFIYKGPQFWNSLSNNIKEAPSLNSFKNRLKLYLLKSYNNTQT